MDIQPIIEFVVRSHAGQTRKTRRNGFYLPYVTHCFEVFKTVWRCGALDEITAPAALGHDLLEDCPGMTEEILIEHLGEIPAAVIVDLTFVAHADDPRPPAEQKAAHLLELKHKSVEAVAIKPCDRFVNVMDFLADDPASAKAYLLKGEPIFDAVDARRQDIDNRFSNGLAERLLKLRTELWEALK